jgi:hypothetical protein
MRPQEAFAASNGPYRIRIRGALALVSCMLFDNSLDWMSSGFAGIVALAFGLTELLAPT